MRYTYLLIDFFTILVPFIFSFHPKIRFDKFFVPFILSAALAAIPFLIWDAVFTDQGVWWFNDRYLIGSRVWGLPIEEILFFICIPFSCVFTFHCLTRFFNLAWSLRIERLVAVCFAVFLFSVGLIFFDRLYTMVTFVSTALLILFAVFIFKINWFGKAMTVYGVLILPFLIVNGLLTGTGLDEPVVSYNNSENLGIRIMTIPVEDTIYGFELFFLTLLFFFLFTRRQNSDSALLRS